jgi:putative tricarboxylic transport membrane protein
MESSLRQSMMMSEGSLNIFFERPIALVLFIAVIASLAWPAFRALQSAGRPKAKAAEDPV